MRNHPGCDKTAEGRADGEAAEHAVGDEGTLAVRAVFVHQRDGVGHGSAKTQAGDEAPDGQGLQVVHQAGGNRCTAHHHRSDDQHGLAAHAVRQRTRAQSAERQAEQGCAQHRAQMGLVDAPFAEQRRRDEADGGGIKTVEQNNQKTEEENPPLKA